MIVVLVVVVWVLVVLVVIVVVVGVVFVVVVFFDVFISFWFWDFGRMWVLGIVVIFCGLFLFLGFVL